MNPGPSTIRLSGGGPGFDLIHHDFNLLRAGSLFPDPVPQTGGSDPLDFYFEQKPANNHPCLCLWRGFSQITRTIPFRFMILHLLHIFLTDGRTFINQKPPFKRPGDSIPLMVE
jgi:hypothetical protein